MLINGEHEIIFIKNSLQTRQGVCVSFVTWLVLTDQLSVNLQCEFIAAERKEERARELFKPTFLSNKIPF